MVLLQVQTPTQITVRCSDRQEMQVKAYPQTRLQQVFSACADRLLLANSELRFFDAEMEFLHGTTSLQEAGINDGDVIECLIQQVGD